MSKHPVVAYMHGVLDGSIPACKLIRLAVERQAADMEHGAERGLHFDRSAAEHALKFFGFLRHSKGEWANQPFELAPWQQFMIWCVFGWRREDGLRRFRTVYQEVPRKNGKALDVETPILTEYGWSKMGWLRVGDRVHAPDGSLTCVKFVSETFVGHDCYEVTFADGQTIVADADHLWTVYDRYREREVTITTADMVGSYLIGNRPMRNERRYRVCPGQELVRDEDYLLPIDPYILGLWLGDGVTDGARFSTMDPELLDAFSQAGYAHHPVGKGCDHSILGLHKALKLLGVLGNKHVPQRYLLASAEQRLALLRGLMDTDGCVNLANGIPRCEFCSTSKALADAALFLARSLGWKATLKTGVARLYGKDCGPKYRVSWTAYSDRSPFRLRRKTARLLPRPDRPQRSTTIAITDVRRVPSRPTRCIQVEHPSHQYLAGEGLIPTHNTTMLAGLGLYLMTADGEPGAEVYSAATKREQAKLSWTEAVRMRSASPSLTRMIQYWRSSDNLSIEATASKFQPLGADSDTMDGLNIHAALIDELHAHKNRGIVDVLDTATGARRQPLIWEITTAGSDQTSVCYEHHEYSRRLLEGTVQDDTWFAFIACLDEGDDWTDERTWAKANPNLGISVKIDDLRRKAERAKMLPAAQNAFRRLHLCQWTQQSERWIDLVLWDANAESVDVEDLEGRECYGGLDLSAVSDLTAWVMVFPREADPEHLDVVARFWCPKARLSDDTNRYLDQYRAWAAAGFLTATDGDAVDYATVRKAVLEDAQRFDLRSLNVDRLFQGYQLSQELADEGLEVFGMGQGFLSMAAPMKEFERRLLEKKLHHGGNPVLRFMADSVVVQMDAAGNLKPDKARSQCRIDGIVGMVMALDRVMRREPKRRSVYEDRGLASV